MALGFHPLKQICCLCYENSSEVVCSSCQLSLTTVKHYCAACALPLNTNNQYCQTCLLDPPSIDKIWALYRYNKTIAYLVSQFKYHKQLAIGVLFAKKIANFYHHQLKNYNYDLIIPMPLHRKRILERGFNQVLEITRLIDSNKIKTKFVKRSKNTKHLTDLTAKQRAQQIKNAFIVQSLPVNIGKILIIDDITTTGSTLNELAKTIKSHYSNCQTHALCLAHA